MDIEQNPFFVLGATTRDDRHRIESLAEERNLLSDEDSWMHARAQLVHPIKRLTAELGWFPGLAPGRVHDALDRLRTDPIGVRDLPGLPALARANLLAEGLVAGAERLGTDEIADWILELARAHESIEPREVMTWINEDRGVAGFPPVADSQVLEKQLQERRQAFRAALKDALNLRSTVDLVTVITRAVAAGTRNGEAHGPILMHDLVDSYQIEAQAFFEQETGNVEKLVETIRAAAGQAEDSAALTSLVSELERVVRNWDFVAQPIQLAARSQGLDHAESHALAGNVRDLAIELFNRHDHLDIARRLTGLLQDVFAEVDEVLEQLTKDAVVLDRIAEERTTLLHQNKARDARWRREITYEAESGGLFKHKIKISPDGVEWKSQRMPLEQISRVRWVGTRHSVNGVSTGSTYVIVVGSTTGEIRVELKEGRIYSEFVERLWKAVGSRLLMEMLEGFKHGEKYRFATASFDDFGVELKRPHLFSENVKVRCRWSEVVIGGANGGFYVAKKDEKKVSAHFSYQDDDNAHVLEAVLRTVLKRGVSSASDLLI
ncbi:hypothetical protein [Thiocapsa sp. UBA6158]|jgi:hypothetical protein|uniref:hypothetical protein n=1 Tax=Thiocapsa sp. UBA6158 TaxID=1947692 RepID=UPI0025D36579|nr:hypothetical protein [Thiocapsa sp. UBA6158]